MSKCGTRNGSVRIAALLLVVLAFTAPTYLFSQAARISQLLYVTSAPTGSCGYGQVQVVRSTGNIYGCVGGTWTLIQTTGGSADWNTLTNKPSTFAPSTHATSHNTGGTDVITVTKSQVGLANVDNTSDASKPVSTATQTALDLKANLASPTFTGVPAAPTAAVDTNTTQIATTAYYIGQAGTATPIVNGTGAAGTSKRFAPIDHVHPTDTSRSPLASPTFTGTPAAPTAAPGTNTTQLATTAFVQAAIGGAVAQSDWFDAAGCNNATAGTTWNLPTTNAPTVACFGTSYRFGALSYPDTSDTTASFFFPLPTGWTGNVDFVARAFVNATSQSVKLTVATACIAAGEDILNPSFNAAQTITTTSPGTANQMFDFDQNTLTMTGCAVGENLIIKVGRDTTDTSTATFNVVGAFVTIRVTPQA